MFSRQLNKSDQKVWGKIHVLSFMVVSLLGMIMRFKIAFSLPWIDQKNMQHAHSHFAFSAWITLGLMLLMTHFLHQEVKTNVSKYNKVLSLQVIVAYTMLISFAFSGYSGISIVLSSLSIIVYIVFTWMFFKDSHHKSSHQSIKWYHASLVLGLLSNIGTIMIAYVSSNHIPDQHAYLASVYFFLHFQYNGWFFFSIIGSLIYYLTNKKSLKIDDRLIFKGLTISVVPAYGLSVLWLKLPILIFIIVGLATLIQLFCVLSLSSFLWKIRRSVFLRWNDPIALTFTFALVALVIKVFLQLGSLHPEISKLAFGFRPIVISYLHLVLLGFTSVLLLGLMHGFCFIVIGVKNLWSLYLILCGIFLNELVLSVQGICSFDYVLLPFNEIILLIISVIIFSGIFSLWFTQDELLKLNNDF